MGMMTPESSRFSHTGHASPSSPLSTNYGTPEYRINRQKAMFGGNSNANISQIGSENHLGGPPTKSLYESLDSRQSLGVSHNMSLNNQSMNQSRLLSGAFGKFKNSSNDINK